ncbi:MAG: YfhO family protein, partial [Vicinamibacteria bacterium]|nr:YfhO family protein [Vicinamibacteria bacterium]
GLFAGDTFYFRDISRAFYPQRLYAVRGLLQGEIRHWNPLVHEGIPLFPPPIGYPIDMLQMLMPSEHGLSLLLALHVPLGALGFYVLTRHLFRSSPTTAIGGALAYALGGFFLSCLNLYVHLQAAAWSPFIVWSLLWAADGSWRRVLLPSFLTAIGLSTSGVEIIAQALLLAIVVTLAHARDWLGSAVRVIAAVIAATALSAPVWLTVFAQTEGSDRAAGFPTEIVLSKSVYPLSLFQIIIADWHGPVSDLVNHFWGENYFPDFPYFMSLYLGAIVLCLSIVGAFFAGLKRWPLLALMFLGLWISIGRWSGVALFVESLPILRFFRFPSKAFFIVHFSVALLTASGLATLASGKRKAWVMLIASSATLGTLLIWTRLVPHLARRFTLWFARGFFPPHYSIPARMECLDRMISDAAVGGALALVVCLVAVIVIRKRLSAHHGMTAVVVLAGADLLRACAGLNPMVPSENIRPSPEMKRTIEAFRAEGGRVFTCDPELSPSYFRVRAAISRHSLWTFRLLSETITPSFNMNADIPTALSRDLTMMSPSERALSVERVGCNADMEDDVVEEMRTAGVRHIVSLMPLRHPDILQVSAYSTGKIAPFTLYLYRLSRPLPLYFVARRVRAARDSAEARAIAHNDRFLLSDGVAVENTTFESANAGGSLLSVTERADSVSLRVFADKRTVVCVRDAHASGWQATINGRPAAVLRANGRHRAVAVEPGVNHVSIEYHPPGLRLGLLIMLVTLAGLATALLAGTTERRHRH